MTGKTINFARGHPNASLLPLDEMQVILTKAAFNTERLTASLNYGTDEGGEAYLEELQGFLQRQCKNDAYPCYQETPDPKLFTTHGVSHGMELICATMASAGDLVLVEKPTYFLVANIFAGHKLRIETLPMNTNGVDCEKLSERLKDGMRPKLVYLIPSHQNPTARTMPLGDRLTLCRLAEIYEFRIVADEVYHLLDWRDVENDGKRPARFSMLTPNALSVSSFTKIFGPGVRCGWIEGPSEDIETIKNYGYIRSQGGCAPFVGYIMQTALETRLADDALDKLNAAYQKRVDILVGILEQDLRLEVVVKPLGGYFLWIRLFAKEHQFLQAADFLEYCLSRGISFLPGDQCDPSKSGSLSQFARLCFADLDETDLRIGAQLFVSLYREFYAKKWAFVFSDGEEVGPGD